MSVCIFALDSLSDVDAVYSETKETQGNTFPPGLRYIYSAKTSNTSLRPHLEKAHRQLYLQLKEKHGWKSQLPGQASQATTAATQAQDVPIDTFSEQTFHQYLLHFIVADDQVCYVRFMLFIILTFALYPSR
jgi:hypothetical protein